MVRFSRSAVRGDDAGQLREKGWIEERGPGPRQSGRCRSGSTPTIVAPDRQRVGSRSEVVEDDRIVAAELDDRAFEFQPVRASWRR